VSLVDDGVDAYQVVANLRRAMVLAGRCYVAVNVSRESRARHTDGLRPGIEHFYGIRIAGERAVKPQLRSSHRRPRVTNPRNQGPESDGPLREAEDNQTARLHLFNRGGNG
jgi:hypothetical protein